jgi:hypothetical protein
MGDQIKDNEKEKNREAERHYIANCIAKDSAAHKQD